MWDMSHVLTSAQAQLLSERFHWTVWHVQTLWLVCVFCYCVTVILILCTDGPEKLDSQVTSHRLETWLGLQDFTALQLLHSSWQIITYRSHPILCLINGFWNRIAPIFKSNPYLLRSAETWLNPRLCIDRSAFNGFQKGVIPVKPWGT